LVGPRGRFSNFSADARGLYPITFETDDFLGSIQGFWGRPKKGKGMRVLWLNDSLLYKSGNAGRKIGPGGGIPLRRAEG